MRIQETYSNHTVAKLWHFVADFDISSFPQKSKCNEEYPQTSRVSLPVVLRRNSRGMFLSILSVLNPWCKVIRE